ncbi:type II toxin-antitoxin system RelE/ParE family toxin [uncultured Mucilaginibacter sp.]|uniref:type II toxin-antitoxin system RelE/ParE family toxin n=1 Tax=uncultured Mucilaginibacter sp. TaxID=797541 RepID=UPI0025D1D0E4|nr:type II toxin-antitoxin system RelE/ParE family toxin [uncultured Mucilaginibacter sp.]
MERKILEVVISDIATQSLEDVFDYGVETFALNAATVFIDELNERIESLSEDYLLYPECRFLKTQSAMYRNLIHGNYLVIYRVAKQRIEVLNVIHGSRSIRFIKSIRKIKI